MSGRADLYNGKAMSTTSENPNSGAGYEPTLNSGHWADISAEKVIRERGPSGSDKKQFTCASGITPSGVIHIGNFREIISVDLVVRALRERGEPVRFLYSWDDYDVFRKVPQSVPNAAEFERYLRWPITLVPDPAGVEESYARANEVELEGLLSLVGIEPEYIYQAQRYRASAYAEGIRTALAAREKIRALLNEHRTQPLPDDWWPVSVFSGFTNKDTTTILDWDGEWGLSYSCDESGKSETVDLRTTSLVKLPWRIDWPMRWQHEQVDFEPAGKDHHSEGGSFDTARGVSEQIYGWKAPVTFQYDFISIKGRGGKISSSSGDVVSLRDVLEVYEPEVVRYLFAGTRPNSEFAISFDMDVVKIYEDYDRCERVYYGVDEMSEKKKAKERRIYELSQVHNPASEAPFQVAFRHLCSLVQIADFNHERALEMARIEAGHAALSEADRARLLRRAACAERWLAEFAPEDFRFRMKTAEAELIEVSSSETAAIRGLAELLQKDWDTLTDKSLAEELYRVSRDAGVEPKDFFVVMYRVLIGKEKGPRLAAFIRTVGRERVLALLERYI